MKKALIMTLAVGLLATGALASEPTTQLKQVYDAMAKGDNAAALKYVITCYDECSKTEAYSGFANTYVLQAWKDLSKKYAPAREALEVRRDAAMARVSNPPVISPALFEALALSRALDDDATVQRLLSQCDRDAAVRTFATSVSTEPTSEASTSVSDTLNEAEVTSVGLRLQAVQMTLDTATTEYERLEAELNDAKSRHAAAQAELDRLVRPITSGAKPLTNYGFQKYLAHVHMQSNLVQAIAAEIASIKDQMAKLRAETLVPLKTELGKIEIGLTELKKLQATTTLKPAVSADLAAMDTQLAQLKKKLSELMAAIEKCI